MSGTPADADLAFAWFSGLCWGLGALFGAHVATAPDPPQLTVLDAPERFQVRSSLRAAGEVDTPSVRVGRAVPIVCGRAVRGREVDEGPLDIRRVKAAVARVEPMLRYCVARRTSASASLEVYVRAGAGDRPSVRFVGEVMSDPGVAVCLEAAAERMKLPRSTTGGTYRFVHHLRVPASRPGLQRVAAQDPR